MNAPEDAPEGAYDAALICAARWSSPKVVCHIRYDDFSKNHNSTATQKLGVGIAPIDVSRRATSILHIFTNVFAFLFSLFGTSNTKKTILVRSWTGLCIINPFYYL